jgi:hypothetical protein
VFDGRISPVVLVTVGVDVLVGVGVGVAVGHIWRPLTLPIESNVTTYSFDLCTIFEYPPGFEL